MAPVRLPDPDAVLGGAGPGVDLLQAADADRVPSSQGLDHEDLLAVGGAGRLDPLLVSLQ